MNTEEEQKVPSMTIDTCHKDVSQSYLIAQARPAGSGAHQSCIACSTGTTFSNEEMLYPVRI
jgi:hypothetical protein